MNPNPLASLNHFTRPVVRIPTPHEKWTSPRHWRARAMAFVHTRTTRVQAGWSVYSRRGQPPRIYEGPEIRTILPDLRPPQIFVGVVPRSGYQRPEARTECCLDPWARE